MRTIKTQKEASIEPFRTRDQPRLECVAIESIKPSQRNARTHSKKQIQQLANSIRRFGWTGLIIIDADGNIIAGYGRYQAAMLLKLRKVPVLIVTDLNETEKRALALADNKIASKAGWNGELLATELSELSERCNNQKICLAMSRLLQSVLHFESSSLARNSTIARETPVPLNSEMETLAHLLHTFPDRIVSAPSVSSMPWRKALEMSSEFTQVEE